MTAYAVRNRLRRMWQRLCGRCTMCNQPKRFHSPECLHCQTNPDRCHTCNKRLNFARLYGAGPNTAARLLAG